MKYDNYEATLKSFPHWYDKSPSSNFSKVIRVFNNQYLDKYHKIRTLDFAQRLYKPIRIHKEQKDNYEYTVMFEAMVDNLKTVNVYVNPSINQDEEIISYEKCFTTHYKDDGHNNVFHFNYEGDTRKMWVGDEYVLKQGDLTVNVVDANGEPLSDATVSLGNITPIIPKDSFIIEVLTYDDYRWVKGFPENDETELFRIFQEQKSYTDYLTFEVKKQNIKSLSLFKDNLPLFEQNFFTNTSSESPVIFHDYKPSKEVAVKHSNVLVADPNKEDYVFRVILGDEDYDVVFDWTNVMLEYPDTEKYIYEFRQSVPTIPSEDTLDKVVIRKRNNKYTAYKTVKTGDEYSFAVIERNIRHTRMLKSNFDLFITTYDKNNPNCQNLDKIIHKRYNGYDKTNYDCFTHDYSLDMIGKYWNVPRLEFNPTAYENSCTKINIDYYKNTYPSYNDRLTEDDYHYQERITRYIQQYNKELFPVLELWKNYQVKGTLRNRKDILSVQDHSYIQEYPYYEDTLITEESNNKLEIINGVGNLISIDDHEWYETVMADNLFVVPDTEYHFNCIFKTKHLFSENERTTVHIYYLDKVGDCRNEEIITLSLAYKERDGDEYIFVMDEVFTTLPNAIKIDVVLEADFNYSFENAVLRKRTIVDKDAMYMATKNDYNSCVYDLTVDYEDVPTNIVFNNTKEFEKLLQRSLPITHKGFLNINNTEKETIGLSSGFGKMTIENLFDYTNNTGNGQSTYQLEVDSLMKGGCHYTLNVKFTSEDTSNETDYILTSLLFKENVESEPLPFNDTPIRSEIKPNTETILNYHFQPPENTKIMILSFETENSNFRYDDLKIKREEPIGLDELWNT